MSFYDKQRALAERLIKKFGANATVYRPEVPSGTDGLGRPTGGSPRVDIDGIATPVLSYKNDEIDGELIKATDGYIFFHSDTLPEIGMFHDASGSTYRIQDLMIIQSRDGIVCLVKAQVRK